MAEPDKKGEPLEVKQGRPQKGALSTYPKKLRDLIFQIRDRHEGWGGNDHIDRAGRRIWLSAKRTARSRCCQPLSETGGPCKRTNPFREEARRRMQDTSQVFSRPMGNGCTGGSSRLGAGPCFLHKYKGCQIKGSLHGIPCPREGKDESAWHRPLPVGTAPGL